jgi:uncharacterized phage protein gp47/JayE
MVELGNPFSVPYQSLIASLERNIREGVEQPVQDRLIFQTGVRTYPLRRNAYRITRVSGLDRNLGFLVYTSDLHYQHRQGSNILTWLDANAGPNNGGRLDVEYTYLEQPAGLTDFNPGSVIGMLVRAVARELKLVYEQMDQVYRRAFIDYAENEALDAVVALLGLQRNAPLPAVGFVTFFRRTVGTQRFLIPPGTEVADQFGHSFMTTTQGIIDNAPLDEFVRHEGGVITVANQIGTLLGVWLRNDDPTTAPPLGTADTSPSPPEPLFGESGREIVLVHTPYPVGELRVRYVAKSVTVPVQAVEPGPDSNVNARTVTIMPTPPTGIEGVFNEEPIAGGTLPESDTQLRERAKFHLERLGNATRNAIKFAVLEVDGVEGVEVLDHTVDSSIPLGQIQVSYFGGNADEVRHVVEQTRAAGVLAELLEIIEVLIAGTFYVIPDETVPVTAVESFREAIFEAIRALEIGQSLSIRRLSAMVYDFAGLAEIAEVQNAAGQLFADPLLVTRTELIRPDETNLNVQLLASLAVTGAVRRVGNTNEIDLQLLTSSGPVAFQNFSLDLTVSVRARLSTAPTQPRTFIGTVQPLPRIAFSGGSNLATLVINDADTNFDAGIHAPDLEVTIGAAIYPGIQTVNAIIDLS